MTISSNKVVQKPTTLVNKNFGVPPGAVDIRNQTEEDVAQSIIDHPESITQGATVDVEYEVVPEISLEEENSDVSLGESGEGTGTLLPIPTSMTIVEQIYNVAQDGTASVDVIIDVPDMPGVDQIEVRMTKV